MQLILSIMAFLSCTLGMTFFLGGISKVSPRTMEQKYKSVVVANKLEILTIVCIISKFVITKI